MKLFNATSSEFKAITSSFHFGNRHHTEGGGKLEKALTQYQMDLGEAALTSGRVFYIVVACKGECEVCNVEFFADWQPILSKP